MTDKPTGVFVRLPNDATDPQWAKAYDAVVGDEGTKKAALWDFIQIAKAIGTPVAGVGLDYCAQIIWHKGELEPEIAAWKGSEIKEGDNIKVARQSDAQAQIAARDAEIAQLQEHLSKITGAHLRLLTKRLVAEIDEEELARLQEENKRLKCKLKPQFFCSDILEESSMDTREDLVEEARGYGDDLQAFSVFKMEGYAKTHTSHGFFDKDIKCHWFDTEQEALDAAKALKGGAA